MVTLQIALLALVASGPGETVLLDFYADWCGPCQQMEPTVRKLTELGYPVRKVDIDQEPELARQHGVRGIPCFVLLHQGKEVDRVVGPADLSRMRGMFDALPAAEVRGQSPDPFSRNQPLPGRQSESPLIPGASLPATPPAGRAAGTSGDMIDRLLAASVRLKIEDPDGHSWGSGVIIDAGGGEALILTCAHIFRDSKGKGRISVDLFGPDAPQGIAGQVVDYDLESDVGLVSIRLQGPAPALTVAPPEYAAARGAPVISVGCNNGQPPTARQSRITSINKFLGPPNLQVAGQPVTGRSGGGLFTPQGLVIGVCNAADPADDEGLYAALASIHALLDRAELTHIYQRSTAAAESGAAVPDPRLPPRMPPAATGGNTTGLGALTGQEAAALAEVRQQSPSAEVICIIRSLTDPRARSEIIVLDRASPEFLEQLSADRGVQAGRHYTSHEVTAGGNGLRTQRPRPKLSTSWRPGWRRPER